MRSWHFFLKQDRKMGISPADRKFDVDIFTSKFDQNRPTGTQDMCQSMESKIYQQIFGMFHSMSSVLAQLSNYYFYVTSRMLQLPNRRPKEAIQRLQVATLKRQVATYRPQIATQRLQNATQRLQVATWRPKITTQRFKVTTKRPKSATLRPQVTIPRPQVAARRLQIPTQRPQIATRRP